MDELDPEVRKVLELVREARAPTQADKARMDALIAGSVGLGATPSAQAAAQGAVKGGAAATLGAKLAVAVAVIGVVGLGAAIIWQKTRQDAPPATPVSQAVVVSAPPAAPAATPAAPRERDSRPHAAEPAVVVKRTGPLESSGAPPTPRGALAEEELDLLHAVQVKWRKGDAKGALVLLKQHRARYPHSQLESERDALTALSLCALGRRETGQKVARRFIRNDPRSPLRATVEESCLP